MRSPRCAARMAGITWTYAACPPNCIIGRNGFPRPYARSFKRRAASTAPSSSPTPIAARAVCSTRCSTTRASSVSPARIATFYLTDFLLRHFERLVIRGLGLDRHPELFSSYFGNYKKLVYLAQAPLPDASARAEGIATRMGLRYELCETGYGTLAATLGSAVERHEKTVVWRR
jgi:hypothetical protein